MELTMAQGYWKRNVDAGRALLHFPRRTLLMMDLQFLVVLFKLLAIESLSLRR